MRLSASVFDFLSQLELHNNRDWFQSQKSLYDQIKAELTAFTTAWIAQMSAFDPSIRRETAQTSMFRIYRDLRFSPDKTPYKTHFGIYVAPGGKSSEFAGYYLHIQHNQSEVACGLWSPPSALLKKVREEIYYESEKFAHIVQNPAFVGSFGSLLENRKLKRAPADFPSDFPYADYLKYRHYIVSHALSDADVCASGFLDSLTAHCRTASDFVSYLNNIISDK